MVARSCLDCADLHPAKPVPSAVPKKKPEPQPTFLSIALPRSLPYCCYQLLLLLLSLLFHPPLPIEPPSGRLILFFSSFTFSRPSSPSPGRLYCYLPSSFPSLSPPSVGRSFVLRPNPELVPFRGPFGLEPNHKQLIEEERKKGNLGTTYTFIQLDYTHRRACPFVRRLLQIAHCRIPASVFQGRIPLPPVHHYRTLPPQLITSRSLLRAG